MLTCGSTLYNECCKKYSLKPNQHIAAQVSRTGLLQLTRIDASQTFLGSLGVHALLDFVEAHRGIESINLRQNGVDQTCVEHLCRILTEGHPCLSTVDLSCNLLSTGSTRLLWETIQTVPTVHSLLLDQCGIADEWMNRLEHALQANVHAKPLYTPADDVGSQETWNLIFVLIIGDEENISRFCDNVILPLGSYLAARRVRIAPVVIAVDDNAQLVEAKVQMCCDPHNYGLPWCVTFVSATNPFSDAQRLALTKVWSIRPMRSGGSKPIDEASLEDFKTFGFFVYAVPVAYKDFEKVRHVDSRRWLKAAGFDEIQVEKFSAALSGPGAPVMLTGSQLLVRCQSDIFSAVARIYTDKSNLPLLDEEAELSAAEHRIQGVIGKLHDKTVKAVMYYVNNKEMEFNVPMLLYGDRGVGKGSIISCIAALLIEKAEEEENPESTKVITYEVGVRPDSIVLFLYFLRSVFNASGTMEYDSVDQLCLAVKESISTYSGKPIVLLVSHLGDMDSTGHDTSLTSDWLPHNFPPNVKIVVTLHNGHPALPNLRQRCPQPFENLCSVLPVRHLVNMFKQELYNRGLSLPGLNDFTRSFRDALTDAESAYLQKEASSDVVFPKIAAAYTECLMKVHGEPHSESAVVSLMGEMPNSVAKVVEMICEYISVLNNPSAVIYVGLSLCASPLPVTELLIICETLGSCTKYSAGVTLREMINMGLVSWDSRSSVASLSHPVVRDAIASLFSEDANKVSVMVEQHLHRLVVTFSPEISWAFRRVVPLMLANGNFGGLRDLLESSLVVDAVLWASPRNQVYLIDGFFRLLASYELLAELAAADIPVDVRLDAVDLAKGLQDVQRHRFNFFQEVVVRGDSTPLARDSQRNLRCANYPLIIPTNRGAEDTSAQILRSDGMCVYCHGRDDYICVGTPETVMVFSVKTGGCLAQRYIPSRGDRITGVLMAAQSKVVIIGKRSIYIWDFPLNNLHPLEGYRTSLEPAYLNADGDLLIVQQLATGAIEIMNIATKRVVAHLARTLSNFSNASFCGEYVLLRLNNCLHLLDKTFAERSVLQHNGPINAACGTADGRLLITSVGGTFSVWTSGGNLIHRIDAGSCPITSVCVDETGSLLITSQSSGVHLWKVRSGTRIATLHTNAAGTTTFLTFTKDKTRIVAITGAILNVWDTQSGIPVGAIASPSGTFTSLFETDGAVYATSTGSDVVRVWNIHNPIPSEKAILEGTVTTNWLKNSKISKHGIESVSVDSKGEVIVALDSTKRILVFSTATGAKLDGPTSAAYSAMALDDHTVAYTRENHPLVYYYDLKSKHETVIALPKTVLPESTLELISSSEGYFAISVATTSQSSALLVCEKKHRGEFFNLCQHSGRVLTACFFGSFMYSLGAEDQQILLWTLPRRACRTNYLHGAAITAASCTPAGVLLYSDRSGAVFRLVPDSLTSATRASLTCTRLCDVYPRIKPVFDSLFVKQIACLSNFTFFLSENRTVAMMDLSKEGPANHTEIQSSASCICTGKCESTDTLFVGTMDGDALRCQIIVPTELPDLHLTI